METRKELSIMLPAVALAGFGGYSILQATRRVGKIGKRGFCSEDEAQKAGWRKAKNCPS